MTLRRFRTTLVQGGKRPYTTWTFLVIPSELAAAWGAGRKMVRGIIAGKPFRGVASSGEGVFRMPVPRELREIAGVKSGDAVEVEIELDTDPRPVKLPDELRAVFEEDPELGRLYEQLAPSMRRAWASYVDMAKRAETRVRRARKAKAGIRAGEFPR